MGCCSSDEDDRRRQHTLLVQEQRRQARQRAEAHALDERGCDGLQQQVGGRREAAAPEESAQVQRQAPRSWANERRAARSFLALFTFTGSRV